MNPVHTFHTFSLRSILIFSQPHLVLPGGLLPSGFPTIILSIISCLSHACYMPRPSHLPWIYEEHNQEAPRYVIFSNLLLLLPLRPKYSPQHPVLNTPSMCSSLNAFLHNSQPAESKWYITLNKCHQMLILTFAQLRYRHCLRVYKLSVHLHLHSGVLRSPLLSFGSYNVSQLCGYALLHSTLPWHPSEPGKSKVVPVL
jgi:hypothetical protein